MLPLILLLQISAPTMSVEVLEPLDHSGLAFDLDSFILPDNEVAHFEAEGFFLPGGHCNSFYWR